MLNIASMRIVMWKYIIAFLKKKIFSFFTNIKNHNGSIKFIFLEM